LLSFVRNRAIHGERDASIERRIVLLDEKTDCASLNSNGRPACRRDPAFSKMHLGSTARRQDEYFAISVSQSAVNSVRSYIDTQEQHHRKMTFQDEYNELLELCGFQKES